MRRRRFLQSAIAAGPTALAGQSSRTQPTVARRMRVGTQSSATPLNVLAALGVESICSGLPSRTLDANWSVEGLTKLREHVESFGISLDLVPLPLSSAYITKAENPNIMLGKSPERDREIDDICQMIRNAARAGIPGLKYNMSILGVVRSDATRGRGGARYSSFVYDQAKQDPPLTEAGRVSAAEAWDRIGYFLKRIIPVANEYKVKMACHPHDPGMPEDRGFRGVHRVLGSVAGLKRFVAIEEGPYHGLNFCQGTVSEMLKDPRREIHDVIRYFASRKKIFNVHFRNIQGGFLNFRETFPDNGDVDFVAAIRTYKDAGYDGMLMPDHVPKIDSDDGGRQAFAYCYGYIRALIQAVYS
ncbi:MAG: mannonate dehydratase [Bryobacteraceae bacterium]